MFRIITKDSGATLALAGDLVGEWAALLEREYARRLGGGPGRGPTLDLAEIRRVDEAGIGVLRRLRDRGARIARCPRVVSELMGGCGP